MISPFTSHIIRKTTKTMSLARHTPAFSLTAILLLLIAATPCHAENELIIVSPHWEGVREEFGHAFERDYQSRTGHPIKVRWRDLGGTSQIEKVIDASFKATPGSAQVDIFFGGGLDPYESQKAKGHLDSCRLPEEILKNIPPSVGGFPIIDPDYTFYGAALSSFGILENKRVVALTGLPAVSTWEDLCRPELMGWVSSSDPRKSGAIHMIYEIILQAYGWEKGWAVIYQMSGNVRSFLQNSSAPTKEVSTGDAAYAITIDINGMTQQAWLGKENVEFKIPPGLSVINPDCIALLKGAPNPDAARDFIAFVMSEKGQSLWMKPTGSPGGPAKFNISRMGVWPSFYEQDLGGLLVPLNPFKINYPFRYQTIKGAKRWGVLNDLIGQSIIDVHSRLRSAWQALCRVPENKRGPLLKKFSEPLVSEAEAAEFSNFWREDPVRARRLANDWMERAVDRYCTIEKEAKKLSADSSRLSAIKQ
ncbi:MAG: extracellular solute-binding protein [Methylacidiphilales bacterium]|nr:extracellular solute-binding protein [Candidatus Methylacidiphilales bacterium]